MTDERYKSAIDATVDTCKGFNAPTCTRAVISTFLDELWQPMDTAPTGLNPSGASTRILLWVEPYGVTTGHFDNGEWNLHSVLNKDAKPIAWMHCMAGPDIERFAGGSE